MATRPDPTTPPDQTPAREPKSAAKGFLTFVGCLTAAAIPAARWLDVLDQAARTFEALKASGLLDIIIGG